ncbi:MAG: GtrA family protein [Candidatus Eisenbacteria sp.]|nr:GtrA family protein [Candidatus Eisenbacteria bacterium]
MPPLGPEVKDRPVPEQKRRGEQWGRTAGQFVRFLIVGGVGTVVNMVVFTLCTDAIGVHYIVASVVAFICAVSSNYFWNRRWTFNWSGRPGVAAQYLQFVAVSLLALGVNVLVLHLVVERASLSPKVGQLTGIAAGTIFNFAGNKFWVFARRER